MDDLDELIIERIPIRTSPAGGFLYALHEPNANYVQIGVGYRSRNGLQMTHICTSNIHQFDIYGRAETIREKGLSLKLGKLAEFFVADRDCQRFQVDGQLADEFADMLLRVHDTAWGNPNAFQVVHVPLADGIRLVWLCYDDDMDRVQVGIGFMDANGEPSLGDASFILNARSLPEFVCSLYTGKATYFFAIPARWPSDTTKWVDHLSDLQAVAVETLRLGDTIWSSAYKPRVKQTRIIYRA